jgi:ribosomal-protein-alanine N-acetyltransferase
MIRSEAAADVRIRPLRVDDAAAVHGLLVANRAYLAPSSPRQDDRYFTLEGQHASVADHVAGAAAGTEAPYVTVVDGRVVGQVSLHRIVRGPLQSAVLGYWTDQARQGAGVASRAVALMVEVARDELGLHRLEAGTLLDNLASQRVLLRNGFEEYGVARRYLRIGDEWLDHKLFQRLLED